MARHTICCLSQLHCRLKAIDKILDGSSNGLFHLVSALASVQTLPHGVYVVMYGPYFNLNNAHKDKKTGEFEGIEQEQ
jgi:hypothetical protein